MIAGITDSATVEVAPAAEPAIIADPGVSPSTEEPISGEVAFTFGFKSATGNLEELELSLIHI